MADTSFYGGKPGLPFIIVKSFLSISEMTEYFKKGPDYSTVHYDEHVLINTENKNDPDNGKIYRRGYDYTNELGGAVYIGTIVGPTGRAPMLEMTTIEEVKRKQETENFENRYSEGEYTSPINMIPGKDGNNYNDSIEWACCCVRNENNEDSTAYIGFKFPYTIVDFTAHSGSPYYNRNNNTNNFINEDLVLREDDGEHPFYEKWKIIIPKGIKGDSLKNFRVMIADNTIEDYDGKADDIKNKRKILVYDYYNFDKEESGEPVSLYLGDYNMIDSINIADNGTITIEYSHNDDTVYTNLFKWIKEVTLDKNTGHFTVKYNYDYDKNGAPTIYETDLSWVKNVTLAEDGTITIEWSTGNTEELPVGIRWITGMEMHSDGTIIVNYNDGTDDSFFNKIQWITNVVLEENGNFTIKYNNGTPDYKTSLIWVRDIDISDDGIITILYNNGESFVFNKKLKYIDHIYFNTTDNKFHVIYNTGEDETINNIIKFINRVYIYDNSNDENSDYKFHIVYNTGEDEAIGEPINYIVEIDIDKIDYHFLIYYSNANYRKLIPIEKRRSHNGKDDWLDLGSIKDDSGILIGFNIPLSASNNLDNITNAIIYLNNEYPLGLTEAKYYGKIITIGNSGENKNFYAFDYDKDTWYYLGTFNNDNSWTLLCSETDPKLEILKNKVSIGGLWFVLEGEDD